MENILQSLAGYWSSEEIAANLNVFLNILGALGLGLIVGYERAYHGRAAGMRTYGLVCMASCALTVITGDPQYWYGGHTPAAVSAIDPGRVIQGITTGVGFLGAGVIMRDGMNISGLTTAASIWAVSAIGVLVGVGFYGAATLLTILATIFMMWGSKLEVLLPARQAVAITLSFKRDASLGEPELSGIIHKMGYEIAKGSFAINRRDGQPEWRFVAVSYGRRKGASLVKLSECFNGLSGIENFHLTHARN